MENKLWGVRFVTEVVVFAPDSAAARRVAKKNESEAIQNVEIDAPERIFAGYGLPTGWTSDVMPFANEEDNEDELTIGEIRAAAVQEFVDAG